MRRRLTQQAGFTLVEVLIAGTLMLIVLSATLTTLDTAGQTRVRSEQQNDTQDLARNALDTIATQIRNLASPTSANLSTIDLAGDYDLIFQTNDPSKRWVRYCLATDNAPHLGITSTTSNGTLWYQTPSLAFLNAAEAPSPEMKATCPVDPVATPASDKGWATAQAVAQHVTNRIGGQDRPVFTYNGNQSNTTLITNIASQLFVDVNPNRKPGEVSLATGEYLRNQNQAPTAAMFKPPSSSGRNFVFNGTASADPEGRTLTYLWYKTTAATPNTSTMPNCTSVSLADTWTCIGDGPVVNYSFPAADGTSQKVYLKVIDPGLLTAIDNTSVALP